MGLQAQPNPLPPKARVVPDNVDSIIRFEKKFSENGSTPAPVNTKSFEFKTGNKKILFIAGHATAHIREGKIKPADAGTGSIVIELNKLLKVPVLYTSFLSPSDPNFEDQNEFKDSLAKIIAKIKPVIVIDLHGSNSFRPYDVDFGTMNGKSYLNRKDLFNALKMALKNEGLINQSQDFFSAEQNQTITKFVSRKGIPCIQLEVNSNYISAKDGDLFGQKTAQLLQALMRFADSITK
ncbi:MAG: ketol-acid reductoisomerase [Chitinophagaceae bacterium]|nr:ketol-acid reductoisomerase [Chitinophagaceae bacterium]